MVTASSGNHGIACAAAAMALGRFIRVFLPQSVAQSKREKIERLGATVEIAGRESGETEKLAARYANDSARRFYISPYNDPEIIAGQGTIGIELIEQLPKIDHVYISLGGGGLVSGIGTAIKQLSPHTRIIGVSATNSAELDASIKSGKHTPVEHSETLADGVAGGMDENSITLELASEVIDDLVVCTEDEIRSAIAGLARHENMLVEGAAALAYAGYLKSSSSERTGNSVIVLCGGNFDVDKILNIVNSNGS
jgi:threonine dehydratase